MQILETEEYAKWFQKLRDKTAKGLINARLRKIELYGEVVGDFKQVGKDVIELRFNTGPGYRVYITIAGKYFILLLIGGDKSTQRADIAKAVELARKWRLER